MISRRFLIISQTDKKIHLLHVLGVWTILQDNVNFVKSLGLTSIIDRPDLPYQAGTLRGELVGTGRPLQKRVYDFLRIVEELYDTYNKSVEQMINAGKSETEAIEKGNTLAKSLFKRIAQDRNLDKPTREEVYFIKSMQLDSSQEKRELAKLNYKLF